MRERSNTAPAVYSTGAGEYPPDDDYADVRPWRWQWPTEAMVIAAILYRVHARGLGALEEPPTQWKLARLNHLAHQEIAERVARMVQRGEVDAG